MKVQLFRPSTKTTITVDPPFQLPNGPLNMLIAYNLNCWADFKYPGFEISGFIF